jgi:hypothetical protein
MRVAFFAVRDSRFAIRFWLLAFGFSLFAFAPGFSLFAIRYSALSLQLPSPSVILSAGGASPPESKDLLLSPADSRP